MIFYLIILLSFLKLFLCEFNEHLLLRPLPDGKILSLFQFNQTSIKFGKFLIKILWK